MNGLADRRTFLWSMGSLVALAWVTLWVWDRSPYGRYLDHSQLDKIGFSASPDSLLFRAALYLGGWTLMTVAMMLPTTLPLIEIFRRLAAVLFDLQPSHHLRLWLRGEKRETRRRDQSDHNLWLW